MDFNYTVFNPKTSRVATEILNKQPAELIRRYIKKKSNVPTKFFESIKEEVNRVDDEEYLINPYLFGMEGKNLDYVANQTFIIASKLKQLGYEFKLNNVARDLDRLFGEYSAEVDKMTKESQVRPISKEITSFLLNDVITNRVIDILESKSSKNTSNDQ